MKNITVPIPGIFSTSTLLTAYNSYNSDGDMQIDVGNTLISILAMYIRDMELDKLRQSGAEFNKIETMIRSSDPELVQLGYQALCEITKYAGKIVKALRSFNKKELEAIIDQYTLNNMSNLTGEIL